MVRLISYWADNTSVGYGQIDANDYFGKVVVSLGSDNYGAYAELTIYFKKLYHNF